MDDHDEAEFRDYVAARTRQFRREGFALCGDWHEAEDLVQHALEKLYVRWSRLRREVRNNNSTNGVDAYVRRTIHNKFLDERRSARWRHTDQSGVIPDQETESSLPHDERGTLIAALQTLPKAQRSVVVLRYWMDLSIKETADTLRISEPKVKTSASRGCAALAIHLSQRERGCEQWKDRMS